MIKLSGLNKNFKDTKIYDDVNYNFKEKSLTCFLGASGSGKTTLLNLIAGFDTNYTGEIDIDGTKINELSIDEFCKFRFNNIGFIFQNYNLLIGYTALENVLMGINLNADISEEIKVKRALDLLSSLGIEDKKDQEVQTLSGGQKQRVAIARALINQPSIILADEPTGALDEDATKAIMEILKKISKEKTVIIITHDEDVASYADEIIELENYNINTKEVAIENSEIAVTNHSEDEKKQLEPKLSRKISTKLSIKNFKIHFLKFMIAAFVIALGSAAFVGALSSKSITGKIINEFKTKNFFYNIGQAPIDKNSENSAEKILNTIKDRDDIENVYYQYDLENIILKNGDKTFNISNKLPTAISKESLVYGVMPRNDKNEIAIAMNVGNKLDNDAKNLLGKEIELQYEDKNGNVKNVVLTVCGLTNSQYQDFIISSTVENELYNNIKLTNEDPTAISFEIKNFEDISKVDNELTDLGINVITRAQEVDSFQNSFMKLLNLYTALSYIILVVGIAISIIILYKVSIERYTDIGLLGALGYKMKNINSIIFKESIYFAIISTLISCGFIFVLDEIYKINFGYNLELNLVSFVILIGINVTLTMVLSNIINLKLIKTPIASALRK